MTTPAKINLCIPGLTCATVFVTPDADPDRAARRMADRLERENGYLMEEIEIDRLAERIRRALEGMEE